MSNVGCPLCEPQEVLCENALAYARPDDNAMSAGHTLVSPRRHVAGFFDMSDDERIAVMDLLATACTIVEARHHPDGYNIGVNVGRAAGQNRMHVHVHLIPRYSGDLPDPKGGVRRILEGKSR